MRESLWLYDIVDFVVIRKLLGDHWAANLYATCTQPTRCKIKRLTPRSSLKAEGKAAGRIFLRLFKRQMTFVYCHSSYARKSLFSFKRVNFVSTFYTYIHKRYHMSKSQYLSTFEHSFQRFLTASDPSIPMIVCKYLFCWSSLILVDLLLSLLISIDPCWSSLILVDLLSPFLIFVPCLYFRFIQIFHQNRELKVIHWISFSIMSEMNWSLGSLVQDCCKLSWLT